MSRPYEQELDPNPLVAALVEKTQAGKLNWEATAREDAFIASVGGETTFKIALEKVETLDFYGNPEFVDQPALSMVDANGRSIWEIHSSQVKDGLWPLFNLAKRIGNKMDDKMASVIEVLQKL